jgi:aminopeptidase
MAQRTGLILGVYQPPSSGSTTAQEKDAPVKEEQLSSAAKVFNESVSGNLLTLLNCSKPIKNRSCRILYGLGDGPNAVAVVGLDQRLPSKHCPTEDIDLVREDCRSAAAVGVNTLREAGVTKIQVDPMGHSDATAEGAFIAAKGSYENKGKAEDKQPVLDIELHDSGNNTAAETAKWNRGRILAEGQNLARWLTDCPANLLTPTDFAEIAVGLGKKHNFEVVVRDQAWAETKGMNSFLSVSQGSAQPPKFLEMTLNKSDARPIILVGKGVTFDSGGISIKPSASMDKMRGDMGGAAAVFSTLVTLSQLPELAVGHLKVLIPLVENMPGARATKPGDIVRAMNGTTIKIDNTDAEGRLILADALCYADTFNPTHVIDVATLTGAVIIALGSAASAVYSNNEELWQALHSAGVFTGDRVWRMPLYKRYKSMLKTDYADLNNISSPPREAGSCTAAAFLKHFTKCTSWAHLDIAGTMEGDSDCVYIKSGMSGRPTRTLVEAVVRLSGGSTDL